MSHELRTPLNAIIGFSDIITKELLGPIGNAQYAEYCNDINESGSHLLSIINEILDLAKAESGKLSLQEDEIDLAGLHRRGACAPAAAGADKSGVDAGTGAAPRRRRHLRRPHASCCRSCST